MSKLFAKLKQRKIVQWALAYLAAAWILLQVLGLAAGTYDWPRLVMQLAFGAVGLGFVIALVLAWYHGERGAQRVSGAELLILALLLAIGGGLLWRFTQTPTVSPTLSSAASAGVNVAATSSVRDTAASVAIPAKSVAVLPFENLSNDKANDYFVAGMQALILTKLADVGELKVISRSSTMKYPSHPDHLRTIGRQLGVATVLEGSVQKSGGQVLINVRLIDAKTDAHLWAQAYTRTLDNVFGVEGEVAEKVAAALKATLSPAETRRLATGLSADPAANDLFLRAEYFANRGNINYDTENWKAAIPIYRQAIRQDASFALARARLAITESALAVFGGGGEDVEQLKIDARAQTERALALAPALPAAHLAIGYIDYHDKRDYAAALKAFSEALKLRPNDAEALTARGYVLRRQGRFDAAIDSFQKALAVDPHNVAPANALGFTYMMTSRYPAAERLLRHALALDPDNVLAKYWYAAAILYGSGDVARALAAVQGESPLLQSRRVYLLILQRKYRAALALLETIPETSDDFPYGYSRALLQADLYRLMGDRAGSRALYSKVLPRARAQLAVQSDDAGLIEVWSDVAASEIGLGHTAAGLTAIGKSQAVFGRAGYDPLELRPMIGNAMLYAEAGRAGLAVSLLARALTTPGMSAYYSPVMLWIDPAWDPLRKDPAFEALLTKYRSAAPAVPTAPRS